MFKSIKLILTSLGFTGLSLAQMLFIPTLNQNSKALANPQNIFSASEKLTCLQLHSDKKIVASVLASKFERKQQRILKITQPNKDSSPEGIKVAQFGLLTYLGTVGGADIYRDPGSGLIIVFIAGVQLAYQTISEAISYIATTIQNVSSKRCEYQGEFFGNPNSPQKTCSYKCKGYGALATFPWSKNKPCPPSFDGNFPGP